MAEEQPQEQQATQSPQEPASQPSQDPQGQEEGPSFTQKDVDKLVGNTRKEARETALSEVLEKAGASSLDEIVSAYADQKRVEEETKSEVEKLQEGYQSLESERDEALSTIYQMQLETELRDKLAGAGAPNDRIKTVMRLVDDSQIDVGEDGEFTGLDEAVKAATEAAPELFGSTQPRHSAPNLQDGGGSTTPSLNSIEGRYEDAKSKGDKSGAISALRQKLRDQQTSANGG